MSRSPWVLLLAMAPALSASCKLGERGAQEDRPLPTPEPSAAYQPAKPAELSPAPAPRPRAPSPTPAGNDTRPAATALPQAPATTGGAAPAATTTATATTTTTSTAAATAAPTGVPSAPAINANCLPKCQTSLQTCVSKPVALDGGLPSLESMAECRKAFDDCRAACGP